MSVLLLVLFPCFAAAAAVDVVDSPVEVDDVVMVAPPDDGVGSTSTSMSSS